MVSKVLKDKQKSSSNKLDFSLFLRNLIPLCLTLTGNIGLLETTVLSKVV